MKKQSLHRIQSSDIEHALGVKSFIETITPVVMFGKDCFFYSDDAEEIEMIKTKAKPLSSIYHETDLELSDEEYNFIIKNLKGK